MYRNSLKQLTIIKLKIGTWIKLTILLQHWIRFIDNGYSNILSILNNLLDTQIKGLLC